ncbi:MAG: Serine/threonine-protein phosphatase 2A activator 1 [Alyxoria varia]|nr:MAG: Serine/threonine-protein phosphatase 2A activator 1 [Alyxoria varia]
MTAGVVQRSNGVEQLDPAGVHDFIEPVKKINDAKDVSFFLKSKAHTEVFTFLLQLNRSMFPKTIELSDGSQETQTWDSYSPSVEWSEPVKKQNALVSSLEGWIDEAPPDTGPRRFGNVSFRTWYGLVESRVDELLDEFVEDPSEHEQSLLNDDSKKELKAYLLGSFGSSQRLDYGTGHELSFLAYLGCLWKLRFFSDAGKPEGEEERVIVMGIIEPYLNLVRRLIKTYTLEPAGSHGVWGLDDHSFLPYIFGSAQLGPSVEDNKSTPTEGSSPDSPETGDIMKTYVVERERSKNMYFGAVGFIYDVKKGPFWEHSPMLYDISGVSEGWAKINKGMLKMYHGEVLSKFPVVQHFPFGKMFPWEQDPRAPPANATGARSSDSSQSSSGSNRSALHSQNGIAPARPAAPSNGNGTTAPWASARGTSRPEAAASLNSSTMAPMARPQSSVAVNGLARGPAGTSTVPSTRAPWASNGSQSTSAGRDAGGATVMSATKAPWAR